MKWLTIVIIALVTVSTQADLDKSKSRGIQDRIGLFGKSHKKRGVLGSIPTYSKGYDIPIVKHSILKPFVVDYPVRSLPVGVKIPVKPAVTQVKYPVPVGHHPPVPYPGYGLKFPSIQNPTHIHPTVVKSEWPVKCAPNIPEAPSVTKTVVSAPAVPFVPTSTVHVAPAISHVPAPSFLPAPVPAFFPAPAPAVFSAPAPTFFPIAAPPLSPIVPLPRPPIPFVSKPFIPINTPIVATAPAPVPAVIKPGNSLHTSFFATFPKHPIVNTAHVAPLVPIAQQPLIPVKVPTAPHYNIPFNVVPSQIGIGKFPVGLIPTGSHFPVNHAIHPQFINVVHPSKIPLGFLPGEQQIPLNQIPLQDVHPGKIPFGDFPLAPQVPISIAPTDRVPLDIFPARPQAPAHPIFGIGPSPTTPVNIFPTAPTPTGGFPIINNDIPVGVGPSPTNVPLGVGQFPIGENPLFVNTPNIPAVGPTIIPTADSGIIPTVQQDEGIDSFGNGVQPIDTNPWIPMNHPSSGPFPTPPQFIPEDEPKFSPTDTTNINNDNQGYHYQPNSNVPFEEINERFRNSGQQRFAGRHNQERYTNHFSLRQHLPLRRPAGNFAGYS